MTAKPKFSDCYLTNHSKNGAMQHLQYNDSNHCEEEQFECSLCDYVSSNENDIQDHSLNCESIELPTNQQDRLSNEDSLGYISELMHTEVKIEEHPFDIQFKQENCIGEISTPVMNQQIEFSQERFANSNSFDSTLVGVLMKDNTGEHLVEINKGNKQAIDFIQQNQLNILKQKNKCKICERDLGSTIALTKHNNFGSVNPYQCSICDKKFCYRVDLTRHRKKSCFSYESNFLKHKKLRRTYTCSCNKCFNTYFDQLQHFKIYRCSSCLKCFTKPSLKIEHLSMKLCKFYPLFKSTNLHKLH